MKNVAALQKIVRTGKVDVNDQMFRLSEYLVTMLFLDERMREMNGGGQSR